MEWLQNIDANTFLFFNSLRSNFQDTFFYLFSGKFIWVPMYAAILFALLRGYNWRQVIIYVIGIALTITLADQMGAHVLRPIFQRPRPSDAASPIVHLVHLANGYQAGGSYGFPSCHAANTFALATIVSFFFRRAALTYFLFLWAIVTCYSRIYLAAHYPGDLLAGAFLGIIIGWVVYLLCSWGCHLIKSLRYKIAEQPVKAILPASSRFRYYPSNLIIIVGIATIIYIAIVSL